MLYFGKDEKIILVVMRLQIRRSDSPISDMNLS